MSDAENKNINKEEELKVPATEEVSSATPIQDWQKKAEEYLAGWQRAKADLINYKRDESGRLGEAMKFANENIVAELLHVVDAFDLGLAATAPESPAYKGMQMIRGQMLDSLRRFGLEAIKDEIGSKFNPELQEAVAAEEQDGEEDRILEIFSPGYKLNGRMLRASKVKVSKKK